MAPHNRVAPLPVASVLAARIHARLLHRGWDLLDLARASGLSRTTLHKLLTQGTRLPHRRTVSRIAAALGISPGEIWGDAAYRGGESSPSPSVIPPGGESANSLDRATNPCVTELASALPELFAGWQPGDWDQLYSTFGTGGPLTPEGVETAAARINRRREAVRQLELVMETHLADVAAEFIATLHRMARPGSNLAAAAELERLLQSRRSSSDRPVHASSNGEPDV